MKAIVATDRHVARLQKNTIPYGKAGFKPSVHAEIDFQPPDLCPNFCVRLHFQPQQHDSHAVKQPVVVDFSVTIRIFKAIYLSGEAGNHARFVMKKDVNHIVYTKILMIIFSFSLTVSAVSRLIPVFGMVV